MKRFFFSLIALAAVATGCTQSAMLETPEHLGTEISFNPYTGRTPETKATSIIGPGGANGVYGLAEAGGFVVYGYLNGETDNPYMNKRTVTSTNGSAWTYTGSILYWPDPNSPSKLDFVAYSANATGLTDETTTGFTFTVQNTVSAQVDLLATALQEDLTLKTNADGKVNLQFKHLLSRIGFKVKANQTNSNRKITISSLKLIGDMPTSGTLNFLTAKGEEYPTLAAGNVQSGVEYSLLSSSPVEISSSTNETQITDGTNGSYMMIMPHTAKNAKIEVEYQITGMSGTKKATVELPGTLEFTKGTAYEFILEISTKAITFGVEETDWNADEKVEDNYPLIPENQEAIELGGAKVNGTESATIVATINAEDLGTVNIGYRKKGETLWQNKVISDYTGTQLKTYNIDITGLDPNTEYEYCAYAVKKDGETTYYPTDGETNGYDTFITLTTITFTTPEISAIQSYDAEMTATYEVGGGATINECGFCWMERVNDTDAPSVTGTSYCSTTERTGRTFTGKTNNSLMPLVTYSCRAYVKNAKGGVSYSSTITFTTAPGPDDVENSGGETGEGGDGTGGDTGGDTGDNEGSDNIGGWEEEDGEVNFS